MTMHKKTSSTLTTCLGVILVNAAITAAHAYDNADFITGAFDRSLSVRSMPSQTSIPLPYGGVVRFVEIAGDRGRLAGIAVVEVRRGAGRLIHSLPELAKASPVEIFYAVSERGTALPKALADAYGESSARRHQGWARNSVAVHHEHGGGGLACPQTDWSWNTFEAFILGKNLPLIFLSEGDGPSTVPAHWFGMGGFVWNYDKLVGSVHNVSAFTTSVLMCELDEQSRAFHPWITVRYRKQSGWVSAVSEEIFDAGDQVTFSWHPIFDPISGELEIGEQYDFELWIGYALGIDKFYIGATWSKPFDTLTSN